MYSTVLDKTDIQHQGNIYYKLQLLRVMQKTGIGYFDHGVI